MPKSQPQEGETLEFKCQWTDRALEDLAAFANTDGGTLWIGIQNDGEVVSAQADDREQGLPESEFANWQGGVRVVFSQDPYTPERLRAMGLNERQIKIVAILRDLQSASIGEIHRFFPDITVKTIQRDLSALVDKGLVNAEGEKKGRRYGLAR